MIALLINLALFAATVVCSIGLINRLVELFGYLTLLKRDVDPLVCDLDILIQQLEEIDPQFECKEFCTAYRECQLQLSYLRTLLCDSSIEKAPFVKECVIQINAQILPDVIYIVKKCRQFPELLSNGDDGRIVLSRFWYYVQCICAEARSPTGNQSSSVWATSTAAMYEKVYKLKLHVIHCVGMS